MKSRTIVMLATLALSVLQLTACASRTPEKPQLNMRNPAASWCVHSGGKLSQVRTDAGTREYCTLPSGERIEEWALFYRDHPEEK